LWEGAQNVDPEGLRASFCSRYGLDDLQVADLEGLLVACKGRVGLIAHPVATRLMEVDLADLADRALVSL
jgi:hypothetical protein